VVTQWLKSVGDEVDVDEPLLEISTDKVDTEIPSPVAGTLVEIVADEDATVEVGGVLAYVGSGDAEPATQPAAQPAAQAASGDGDAASAEGEDSDAAGQAQIPPEMESGEEAPEPQEREQQAAAPSEPKTVSDSASVGYVTPLVRKLATDKGVDLAEVSGSGVGGRIRKQDVLAAAEAAEKASAPAAAPASAPAQETAGKKAEKPAAKVSPLRGTTEKMTRLRKIVATRMLESQEVSAQLTTVMEVDMSRVAELRARAKDDFLSREGAKLTYMPFIALATTEALKEHPQLNASIEGEEIIYHGAEHLGVAVDTPRGLLVPVLKDAGDLNIAGVARKIADLAERTRTNKVMPDELSGGTFTLTNNGTGGALFATPILMQPQVGILGIGTIKKRPVVVEMEGADVIAVRHIMHLALTYDHRLVDGADAGRFLSTIKARLEDGAFEADLGL
ncbi:MAG TPA: 2-oxoglutarate dehydrogenase, E2 component, dihydrolipoamide succinyltransferase, partial [Beutenbergiaceae bacterium]|nr:2-oxoglutarate dehydrogenase, E2 component, dihydrolipoamide succinyltransferase [Beutenbergiaceae bacterium]